ncbi:MAG: L-threonylcarbamoyladenylate synthase [Planctomycetota bacterium]
MRGRLLQPDQVDEAAALLRGGGLVAFATETVYGLGADATDPAAVARVFAAKDRPSFDPLIVHAADTGSALSLADPGGVPAAARRLAAEFWPGPLTLVLPKTSAIPGIVTSGLNTVGLRVPGHDLARELIRRAGVPVAAPSANAFGGISPTRAEHVVVPCEAVLDGGPCVTGVESTVVGFADDGTPTLLRPGGTPAEAIGAVLGRPLALPDPAGGGDRPRSPGMLARHYAPRTPLRCVERIEQLLPAELGGRRVGLLSLRGEAGRGMGFAKIKALSPRGDLVEAAANLFDAMHRLDAAGLDLIVAEAVPASGLGRAINDRLRRAAAPAAQSLGNRP